MAQHSTHLKAGLAAGAILGLAAGLFLQSRKGKQLTKDARKKALQLQAQVMKKLQSVEMLNKEKYTEVVDHVLAYYTKSKEVAQTEIPEVRSFLLGRWQEIQKQFKKVK
ncbi:hypothetical protein EXS71_02935 [Candidatus Uhrbacteria bacterium]|nr:hypothetical protein [Candidatus Uhrbacteria bacterium]